GAAQAAQRSAQHARYPDQHEEAATGCDGNERRPDVTLSPIRITGGPVGGSYPPAGLIAEYEPPSGTRWMLTSADGDRHRNIFVLPGGLQGLRGRVEWAETESVNQYGVRRSGPRNFRTPPLDISLTLGLRAKRGEME